MMGLQLPTERFAKKKKKSNQDYNFIILAQRPQLELLFKREKSLSCGVPVGLHPRYLI